MENQAVDCARKLRPAFSEMVKRRGLSVETELEIGLGSGPVAVGTWGHRSHLQQDVMGQAVIQAEMIGHHQGIVVTERVYDRVKSNYAARKLPDFTEKGRAGLLAVWEVSEGA
jgi:class 3 adenylate cyclase